MRDSASTATRSFLETVFPCTIPDGSVFCLFDLDTKQTRHFAPEPADYLAASQWVDSLSAETGFHALYFNVCPQRAGAEGRGKKSDVTCATMLWADVDLDSKQDAKKKYPPRDVAIEAIRRMPLQPTYIIASSGGGLYPIWILKEPIVFNDHFTAEDFEEQISKPWQQLLRLLLEEAGGYAIDSVHDVTRMLRIVGSRHKSGSVVTVLHEQPRARFSRDNFMRYTATAQARTEAAIAAGFSKQQRIFNPDEEVKISDGLRFDPRAAPHYDKIKGMCDASQEFKQVWERKRKKLKDQSASGYCLSLVNYLVMAGMSDQDIVDFYICWRRDHKESLDMKEAKRKCEIDIRKARLSHKSGQADEVITSHAEAVEEAKIEGKPVEIEPDKRAKLLANLAQKVGVKINAWIKIGRENAVYYLVLGDGTKVYMGRVDYWTQMNKFKNKINEQLNVMPSFGKLMWGAIITTLNSLTEEVQEDFSMTNRLRRALFEHMEEDAGRAIEDRDKARDKRQPYVDDGVFYFTLTGLFAFMRFRDYIKTSDGVAEGAIRQIGGERKKLDVHLDGKHTSRSYWVIPVKNLIDPLERGETATLTLADADRVSA